MTDNEFKITYSLGPPEEVIQDGDKITMQTAEVTITSKLGDWHYLYPSRSIFTNSVQGRVFIIKQAKSGFVREIANKLNQPS